MRTISIVALIYCTIIITMIESRTTFTKCQECNGEDNLCEPLTFCMFGTYTDSCYRERCISGPEQQCGGKHDIYGRCAENLHCKDNVCTGCTLTPDGLFACF